MRRSGHSIGRTVAGAVLTAWVGMAAGCTWGPPEITSTFETEQGLVSITLPSRDRARLPAATREARIVVSELHRELSIFSKDSELSAINRVAGEVRLPTSRMTRRLLLLADEYYLASDGAFDITAAPLLQAWGLYGDEIPDEPPTLDDLDLILPSVGMHNVVLDPYTIRLDSPGTRLDPGPLLTGFVVDEITQVFESLTLTNALIRLGGSYRALGSRKPNKPWTIDLALPGEQPVLLGRLRLESGQAVSVITPFEPGVVIDGKRYSSTIDPRTGLPAGDMQLAAAMAPSGAEAMAMCHAAIVLGRDEGSRLVEARNGCGALLVPQHDTSEIWLTRAVSQRFHAAAQFADAVRVTNLLDARSHE